MASLTQWIASQGKWTRSRFADLPELRHDGGAHLQHWYAITGGLALILSRAGNSELHGRFGATHELYHLARRQLKQGRRVEIGAELLGDVIHEVTGIADPMTKASLNACFHSRVEGRRKALAEAAQPEPAAEPSSLQLLSQSMPDHSHQSRRPQDFVNSDIFIEHASMLRKKVAAARATGLAEPR